MRPRTRCERGCRQPTVATPCRAVAEKLLDPTDIASVLEEFPCFRADHTAQRGLIPPRLLRTFRCQISRRQARHPIRAPLAGFEVLQNLLRALDHMIGEPCQPTDVDPVAPVAGTRADALHEHDLVAVLGHLDLVVPDTGKHRFELCELMVVGRKHGHGLRRPLVNPLAD